MLFTAQRATGQREDSHAAKRWVPWLQPPIPDAPCWRDGSTPQGESSDKRARTGLSTITPARLTMKQHKEEREDRSPRPPC